MKTKLLSLVAVVALFSCKSGKNNQGKMQMLESGSFKVLSVDGSDVSNNNLTMEIDLDENRISGNTGCNTYGADFIQDGKTINMGYARVTKRYCKGKMDVEQKFLKRLKEVKTYSYDGEKLQLQSINGENLIASKREGNE